jgi:hypothetical protein
MAVHLFYLWRFFYFTALVSAQQRARAADLEVALSELEARPKLAKLLQGIEALLGSGFGVRVKVRVQGVGLRAEGLGFRVQGVGLRAEVDCLGLRVGAEG